MTSLIETRDYQLIDAELLAGWKPRPIMRPSEWAERNVVLRRGESSRPGPLDHRNAPYLRGFLDLANAPGVEELDGMKAGQIGFSAAVHWLIGYWADLDPDPCGLALPNQKKGRSIVSMRLLPFFRATPCLAKRMSSRTQDESSEKIILGDGFVLHLMWAGSSTSTSSDPMRRVINDEVDKMKSWGGGGGEGHTVFRTKTRLSTYDDNKIQINISTPTTRLGMIFRLFQACTVHLYFLIPCPHCQTRIRMVWSQVGWRHYTGAERAETNRGWAEKVRAEGAAWYVCQACNEKFDDRQRKRAVQQGWYGTIDPETGIGDGVIERAEERERWPAGTKIGVHVSALYCMWKSLASLAGQYIESIGNVEAMYTFITEILGETFEQQIERTEVNFYAERSREARLDEGVLPWWTHALITTIDTQADHFWAVIRAWGPQMRSQRVYHGRVETFEELDRLCFEHRFRFEQDRFAPITADDLVLIDSGGTRLAGHSVSRTMDVYEWVLQHGSNVRAIKGDNKPQAGRFFRVGRGLYDPGESDAERIEVPLWLLDVHHYQDALADLMRKRFAPDGDDELGEPAWQLNLRNDPEYNQHMAAVDKIAVEEGGTLVERWATVTENARHDLRDCEVYQVAAAYLKRVHLLPSIEQYAEQIEEESRQLAEINDRPARQTGFTLPDGRRFLITSR